MTKTVESIMQRDLVVAAPEETIADAVQRLARRDVGALLVVTDGELSGILSERDVMRRVLARGLDPAALTVCEVATPTPVAVSEGTTLKMCTRMIQEAGFRHLPIVNAEYQPIGIISSRDLLQSVVEGLEAHIERERIAQHREEITDPYESVAPGVRV